jgi:hypothetical protein
MRFLLSALVEFFLFCTVPAFAIGFGPGDMPAQLCRRAIAASERVHGIPPHLLAAIGRIESGRRDPTTGVVHPWPWTINAEREGRFFESKQQAIAAVRALQAKGVRSIDVGCMQVNLLHHPDAFPTLDQAFEPSANTDYAAHFLHELFDQSGAWPTATGLYHSATPELAEPYRKQVLAAWPEETRNQSASAAVSALPSAWNASTSAARPMTPPYEKGPVARILSLARSADGSAPIGRDLASYRSSPVFVSGRPLMRTRG